MSATNSTTHYELPVFIATDKPAWLVDWNGSMNAIDAGIYAAKSAADTAQAGVAANASDISTLSSTVTSQGSSLSTLSENLTTLTGAVNTINSLIGNGEPTTTDKTLIGAINEINSEISDPTAAGISYDNTTSGMTADDVQDAIDENAAAIAALNTASTWTLVDTATGTTSIALPSADEYLIEVSIYGAGSVTSVVPAATLSSTAKGIIVGGGSQSTAYYNIAIATLTNSSAAISHVYANGSEITSQCTIKVYKRG